MKVGAKYENRNGVYKVLAIQGDRLLVEYDNGKQQELSLKLQKRILRSRAQREKTRRKKRRHQLAANHRKQIQRPKQHFQPSTNQAGMTYQAHCWRCGKSINSDKNKRCLNCGWYKCSCGACNCNRPKDAGSSNLYL